MSDCGLLAITRPEQLLFCRTVALRSNGSSWLSRLELQAGMRVQFVSLQGFASFVSACPLLFAPGLQRAALVSKALQIAQIEVPVGMQKMLSPHRKRCAPEASSSFEAYRFVPLSRNKR